MYILGMSMGLGEQENCRPISSRIVLQNRKDITDFNIDRYSNKCSISELTPDLKLEEPYKSILETLLNNGNDREMIFEKEFEK